MKAFEARKKYFEKHVGFEHYVRKLANVLGIKTKAKSLGVVIDELVSHNKFKFLKLTASVLRLQKQSRNGLGHTYANTNASEAMVKKFEMVDNINEKLVEAKKGVVMDVQKDKIKSAS